MVAKTWGKYSMICWVKSVNVSLITAFQLKPESARSAMALFPCLFFKGLCFPGWLKIILLFRAFSSARAIFYSLLIPPLLHWRHESARQSL